MRFTRACTFFHPRSPTQAHRLTIAMAIMFALTVIFPHSAQGQNFDGGSTSSLATTRDATQRARTLPHLDVGSGRELDYVGMFQPDGKFRRTSRRTRFMDARSTTLSWSPEARAARQRDVPPSMLSSYVRRVDDVAPPGHAIALPEVQSLAGEVRNGIVSFVYGRLPVLKTPQHLTTDSQQRIIISDPGVPAIHVLDAKGKSSFSILGGPGRRLQSPAGVAVDQEDNIYVADSELGMILVYDPHGQFLRYIGNFHGERMYQGPSGIAIDRKAGHLYLVDSPRHLVLLLDLQGNLLRRNGVQWDDSAGFELKRRDDAQPFNNPTEIAVSGDEVAVLDTAGTRVQIMDLECNLLSGFNIANPSADDRDRDNGLALDSRGNIYVAYADTSEARMYNRVGKLVASFGQAGSKAGEFSAPRGLWFDASDRFYVTDTANARVQLFQLTDR